MRNEIIQGYVRIPSAASIREQQARRLFKRFGDVLGIGTFKAYLNGTDSLKAVPEIPPFPATHARLFGLGRESVCLIDRRAAREVRFAEYCGLAGLEYSGDDATLEAFDPGQIEEDDLYWMMYQDGYRNRNRKHADCRATLTPLEFGMNAIEGVGVYVQRPDTIANHYMDLPGSVPRTDRNGCASLGPFGGKPRLSWHWGEYACPEFGTATRGK